LLGALGILLTAVFFNTRYNRLKVKSDQERKLLIQENKMLNLQQKALQLQMNPHFVFNALNSIQGLIAKEDNKKARRYLQQFSSMMRSVLNQSREEKISLDDEMAYLKSYLSLEQMANNHSFDFDIISHPNMEDGIDIPTMIIQPFIENAIIHGVKSLKDRRGNISVRFDLEGNNLKCTISDNGLGRKAAAKHKVSTHKSVALDVVNERLKGKGVRSNPVKYTDKHDEQGNPIGTDVEISMPLS
jgi:LytS/YehU family sensor histidine kinase